MKGSKTMSKEKQIDIIIDLLVEFDEMGFAPTTLVPDPEAYAVKWRNELTNALIAYRKQSEGEWEQRTDVVGFVRCSVCKDCNVYDEWAHGKKWKFCPHCGAHMRKEDEVK